MVISRDKLQGLNLPIKTKLWAQVLTGMALGVVVGVLFSPTAGSPFALSEENAAYVGDWLRLPGTVFLNLIQMVVIPLIATSIILGITTAGDPRFLRRTAMRIVPYFVATTTVAVLIGAGLANLIEPGRLIDNTLLSVDVGASPEGLNAAAAVEQTSLAVMLADLIPSNPSEATLYRNMLQIVVATIIVAVAISTLSGSKTKPLRELLQIAQDVVLKIVSWAMMLAPLAVFGLISDFVLRVGLAALAGMSVYILTVIAGLLILLGVYLLIVTFVAGRSPRKFLGSVVDAQLLAFSTSSSAATMPLSLETAQSRLGVRPAIAKFIIPLGATVNMDGTALYQTVAALFIAQIYGVSLSPEALAVLMFTVVGASIGSPSTPGVGIIILATVLQSIGVPPEGAAILLGVDRVLDMCRTSINVTGDLTACVVMDGWLADDLEEDAHDDAAGPAPLLEGEEPVHG